MTDDEIWKYFSSGMLEELQPFDRFEAERPLLVHYTATETLELILKNNEIWFSNPLYMNDPEELRAGFEFGLRAIEDCPEINVALGSDARIAGFHSMLKFYVKTFEEDGLLDTYVLSLCEQSLSDEDGLLSMWRGYGNWGKGAAIGFDTSRLSITSEAPIAIAPVKYLAKDQRLEWCGNGARKIAQLLREQNVPDDKIFHAARAVFERIRTFALFSKHRGYSEEKEWRAVYLKDRDNGFRLEPFLGYHIGPHGIEPKLKLKFQHIEGVTSEDFSLNKLLAFIMLGPNSDRPLALLSAHRMLEKIGLSQFKTFVRASTIPFRS